MTKETEHILSAALELPMSERLVLMQQILASFESVADAVQSQLRVKTEPEVREEAPKAKAESWETPAFYAEMDRRVASIKDGTAKRIPAKEAIEKLRAAL